MLRFVSRPRSALADAATRVLTLFAPTEFAGCRPLNAWRRLRLARGWVVLVMLLVQSIGCAQVLDLAFDDNGTVAYDRSPYHSDCQIYGATPSRGIAGNALWFDGGDCLELQAPQLTNLAIGSISVWFKLAEVTDYMYSPVFYCGDDSTYATVEIGHRSPNNSKLYFTFARNGIPLCFDTGTNLQANVWYHFVGVCGEGFNTGYLNGLELTNRHYNYGGPITSFFLSQLGCTGVRVGATSGDDFFKGAIGDLKVYGSALSGNQIAREYQRVVSVPGLRIAAQGSGFVLTWPSTADEQFAVQYSSRLDSWVTLAQGIVGTPDQSSFTTKSATPFLFYRVLRH
jgi:hypothetical protein